MPDQPVYQEFGKPMSSDGKLSNQIFEERYGKYKTLVVEMPSGKPASSKLDPTPFTGAK